MAANTGKQEAALRLRGLPRSLSMSHPVLAGHDRVELKLPDALAAHAGAATVSLPVREKRGKVAAVRLRLNRRAPPGCYTAKLAIGDETRDISLDIAPAPRLAIFPPSAHFDAAAGKEAVLDITFTNTGNVAIDLPERAVVGLFDDDGLEMAFVETYRQQTDSPTELLGTWLRSLRNGYGGLLKLRVTGGGALLPGDERIIRAAAHVPEGLSAGHSYHGVWELGPVNYRIAVTAQR